MAESADAIHDAHNFPGERRLNDVDQMHVLGFLEGKLYATPTTVAVISDRCPLNLESLANYAANTGSLAVKGVILPGSELDGDLTRLVVDEWVLAAALDGDTSELERLKGFNQAGNLVDRGDFVIRQPHPITGKAEELFRLAHEPYDAGKLRESDGDGSAYRRGFGRRLVRHLQAMDPSVIFLDNFKVILPETVVEEFPGKIINIHPSILPLLKGFRPERRAMEGENPQASGYTMHVISEELDSGVTLFQQRVPIAPDDEAKRAEMGNEAYQEWREEQSRLRIMVAQSPFVPWVLHLYNSSLERKVVEDAEAFAAEGRPGFEKSSAYVRAKADEPETVYRRILFENPLTHVRDNEPEFVTLERLLSAPAAAEVPSAISGIHRYDFTVPVLTDNPNATTYTDIEYLIRDLNAAGLGATLETGEILPERAEVSLRTMVDCRPILLNMGIICGNHQQKVHVRTPRQPVAADQLFTIAEPS